MTEPLLVAVQSCSLQTDGWLQGGCELTITKSGGICENKVKKGRQ